jgi:DNA repair protein SbcD/Mre11
MMRERTFVRRRVPIMEKIRFIHCADLHLDSPFKGLRQLPVEIFDRIQNSTFKAFENLINESISREVNFIIISGDLFDEEDRSIRAQARLQRQLKKLAKHAIPVYIIHGNHDHLGGHRIGLDFPENVHIFGPDVETKIFQTASGTEVHLTGFSYRSRHITERVISEYQKASVDQNYYIGLLHGSEGGVKSLHDTYAPFSVLELLEKNYHYWALGHIHEKKILHKDPYIVYPGNIQGRHRKESGEKGCYEVILDGNQTSLKWIETQDLIWEKVNVSMKHIHRFGEVFQKLQSVLEEFREYNGALVEIEMKDIEHLSPETLRRIDNGELLEALQVYEEAENFVWVHKLTYQHLQQETQTTEGFLTDLTSSLSKQSEEDWEEALMELYEHPQAFRYLDVLTSEEKDRIRQEVFQLLVRE